MNARPDPLDEVSEILDAARAAAVEGNAIVERAHVDYRLAQSFYDDSEKIPLPTLPYWKRRDPTVEATPSAISEMLINLIAYIVNAERAGRPKVAGLGLARLREHYEAFDAEELPPDEQSWQAFAAKHVPLPPEQVAELIGKMVHHRRTMLRCTKCGTFSRCACGCGRPYVNEHRWSLSVEAMLAEATPERASQPSALDRAAAAIAASPEKSNRTLAAEIGVITRRTVKARASASRTGIRRWRRQRVAALMPPPDRRTGRDGRSYPVARKPAPTPSDYFEAINVFHGELVGFLTEFSGRFAAWREDAGPLDDEGKATLMQALYLCGDGFMRVAQELDGR